MADRQAPTTPAAVRGEIQRQRVVALRMEGLSLRAIGAELGISGPAVHKHLKRALKIHRAETEAEVARLRAMEAARLTALSDAIWERAMDGQLGAIDRALKIRESYRRLLGLDVERKSADDGLTTIVVDLRLPGHEDVVDGEIIERDVTPQIGGG